MAIGANPIGLGIDGTRGTGLGASIRTGVISGEELEKSVQEKKTTDYFNNRQKINNDIVTGKITSGNPGKDTITVRKNNLVSLFAADALEKGANPDKVMAITKKPDEILKRLTGLGEQQANAVNEYLMNGGYADRVFDYVMGNSKNPYTKKEDTNNYLGGVKSVPEKTVGTIVDLAQKGLSKIGLTKNAEEQNKEDYEKYSELTNSMSTEDYNAYKEGKAKGSKLFDTGIYKKYEAFNEQGQSFVNGGLKSRADMYDAYDKAVEDGFNGSVEDYANYMNNMAAKVAGGIYDAINREIENTYDTESGAFKAGKITGDILEFMATPELKIAKGLKYVPKVGKYIDKGVEKAGDWAIQNYPKVTKWIKGLDQGIESGIKMQAMEDAYNNELSDTEKYITTAAINAAVGGVLDGLGNIITAPRKLIGNPRGEAKTAIGKKTTAEWDEMTNITKESLSNPNAEVTPYTRLADLLKKAKQELIDKRVISGKTLQKTRQKLQFKQGEKYTLQDLEEQLNKKLMSVSKYSSQGKGKWDANSVPQISFKNGKLEISNLDKLNLFSKVETNSAGNVTKTVNLGDKIQNIWDSTIGVGKKPNATTIEQFLRALKDEVHTGYKGGESNMIGILRKGVDSAWNKYKKTLTADSRKSLGEAVSNSAGDIQLANTFDDLIGSLDGSIYSAGAAEKAARSAQATKRLFKVIYDKTEGRIDMNNEINAWLANLALYGDKNSAMALLDTIYPSVPGMYEFFIKNFVGSMKRAGARRATSDYAQQASKTFNEGTTIPGNVWDNIRNNVKGLKNSIGGGIYMESK